MVAAQHWLVTEPGTWERDLRGPELCDCHEPKQRHDRWMLMHAGHLQRQVSDTAISTFGRVRIAALLVRAGAPPLPEQAWEVLG